MRESRVAIPKAKLAQSVNAMRAFRGSVQSNVLLCAFCIQCISSHRQLQFGTRGEIAQLGSVQTLDVGPQIHCSLPCLWGVGIFDFCTAEI